MFEERRYTEAPKNPVLAGEFMSLGNALVVHLRAFQFPGMYLPSQLVEFDFDQKRISAIRGPKGDISFLELEPVEIARLYGPKRQSRILVNIKQVPQHLIDAVLSIEDHRFYEHSGIDFWGILRAAIADLRAGRVVQGGSTITQQLVKNCFLEPQRTFRRKFLEFCMSLIMDGLYTKDEILEMYLNEIYMGQRGGVAIHGIGEAAIYYFGCNVQDLTLAESAMLAGMIRAPNFYSPRKNRHEALERRNLVLARMLELGKITPSQYDAALVEVPRLAPASNPASIAPYFVDYVRIQAHVLYAPEKLASEGLSIYTTLQPEMAAAAETAIRNGLAEIENESAEAAAPDESQPPEPLQAVLIALQPETGEIYALVGGRNYRKSGFDRALDGRYQPGSAIQPFIYLAALDRFKLSDRLLDLPVPYELNGISWTPWNYDGVYLGKVSFREALERSLNAATANLAAETGVDKIVGMLERLGIQSSPEDLPSLALGSFKLSPMELARAYTVLANNGQMPFLYSLREIVSENGEVLDRRHIGYSSVTSAAKAFLITNILEGAVKRGSARGVKRLGIDFPCACQTGTTSDLKDSWFVGYTSDLLTLVWVGRDGNSPVGLTGAQGAERIWARFMNLARPWIHPHEFHAPPGVVKEMICPGSGQAASALCKDPKMEYFLTTNRLGGPPIPSDLHSASCPTPRSAQDQRRTCATREMMRRGEACSPPKAEAYGVGQYGG